MDPMGSREQEPKTSGWKKPRIALLLAALIAAGAIGYAALRDGAPGSTDASTAAAGDLPLIDTLERQAADTPGDAATAASPMRYAPMAARQIWTPTGPQTGRCWERPRSMRARPIRFPTRP
jgi:hypothetical protein